MTPERIERLETLAKAASSGRWVAGTSDNAYGDRVVSVAIPEAPAPEGKIKVVAETGNYGDYQHAASWADACFIAASRDGVIGLIEHIVGQEQELNLLREALESVAQASNAVSMFR